MEYLVARRKELDAKSDNEWLTSSEAKEYTSIQRRYGVLNPVKPTYKKAKEMALEQKEFAFNKRLSDSDSYYFNRLLNH